MQDFVEREESASSDGDDKELVAPTHTHINDIQAVHHERGLSVVAVVIFLAGEMAGSGMLALPRCLANSGWTGVVLIIVCCGVAAYNGIHLGRCWIMLLERYPEYREHCRAPYPAIAEKAVGVWMKRIVEVAIDVTLFGAAIVYMILISQSVHSLVSANFGLNLNFCAWLAVVTGVVMPFTWFGSPKDFTWVAITALASVLIVGIIIPVSSLLEITSSDHEFKESSPTIKSFFLAYGTLLFAFGGASTFPTIQHDMKKPAMFKYSVIVAFIILLVMYLPMAITSYYAYGDDVNANVLLSMAPGPRRTVAEVFISVHLFFALIIVFNPPAQHLEDLLNIAHVFHWKRVLLRTITILVLLFIAETLPHFGAILDFIGGSTVCFLTFVAPSLFYMKLCAAEGDWPKTEIPLHEKVIHIELIVIGILGGIASTVSALHELTSPGTFVTPCFINATAAQGAQ